MNNSNSRRYNHLSAKHEAKVVHLVVKLLGVGIPGFSCCLPAVPVAAYRIVG